VSKLVVRENPKGRDRRRRAVRKKISGTPERPRLSVFRGNRGMSCQVIDDVQGSTIVYASSLEKELKSASPANKTEAARLLGATIAKRAVEKGVTTVVFDRGGYKYHGRVKALADAARENGLKF
jgi:large subunit ribosomal protein L18